MTLVAHEQEVSVIFSKSYVFSIPGYQRPYSWTIEQAGDLFNDLLGSMEDHHSAVSDMPPYFLGSIVLIKNLGPEAQVVDGQQRLTTLTLLLSALRANLPSLQATEITALIYEKGSTLQETPDRFRLSLRVQDNEFFKTYVQREGGFSDLIVLDSELSEPKTRLRENARFFQVRVQALSEAQRLRLAQFVVTRCFLVAVSTPDQDSAFRTFSVLNSRGLDLTATDILKADIIGSIPSGFQQTYTDKWEKAEEELGRNEFDDLFGHIRTVFRKVKPKNTLLQEFRNHVSIKFEPIELIDKIILPMAVAYGELIAGNYTSESGAEAVNEGLRWLNRLEFTDWIPPTLAFTTRYRNSPKVMKEFIRDMERISYSMLIRRISTNDRIDRFSRITQAIENGADLSSDEYTLQLTAQEREATLIVIDGPIYESLSARARSTLLVRLDALVAGPGATYDYPVISVEHVLPQNPGAESEWVQWFPDSEQRIGLVHRIGNLALLNRKKNSAASNFDFERKKQIYFKVGGVSPFPLTTQVLSHLTWTPDTIISRQDMLIATLTNHWRLQS